MIWIPLIFLTLVGSINALLPTFGPCPDVKPMESLDYSRYLGKWYEAEKYFSIIDFGARCGTFNYSKDENGALKLVNSQISALTGIESTIEGRARPIERADDPKFSVSYPSLPINYPTPHWVLGTDYNNYAVLWSCSNMGLLSLKSAWILTRERHPPVSVLEAAYKILDRNQISRAYFSRTDQKNCPASKERNFLIRTYRKVSKY
ncbi:apolipoprotein D-like [Chelonus insularis]|uniref:apolipoprotein D-like n=1 Tax=Chelonus insularis TaxID=460826 RepID=UPI00158F505D|nr:apolipoprotein D-like [Chelonus insularis]